MHELLPIPLSTILDARYHQLPLSEKYRRLKSVFPRGIERGYEFFAAEGANSDVVVIRIPDGKALCFDSGMFDVALGFDDPVSLEQLREHFRTQFGEAPRQCT